MQRLAEKNKHYLTKDEVKAVMTRRDKIVALFEKLISEKGEKEVLCWIMRLLNCPPGNMQIIQKKKINQVRACGSDLYSCRDVRTPAAHNDGYRVSWQGFLRGSAFGAHFSPAPKAS